MLYKFKHFLQRRKYEVLLIALIQHLFIGAVIKDLAFYTKVIWPINMLILGVASVGVFIGKGAWKNGIRNVLFLLVFIFPLSSPFIGQLHHFMVILSIAYVFFFMFIFYEVVQFLIKPGYINADIISAAACGYFLLIEVSVFVMQSMIYLNPYCFSGVDISSHASIFIDLVYFCSVTVTSIGFGDITPITHHAKLVTSFLGIAGQFYSVVLVGILISKFSNKEIEEEATDERAD